jgi:hypothetical protein
MLKIFDGHRSVRVAFTAKALRGELQAVATVAVFHRISFI